jgi:hypothetical protein
MSSMGALHRRAMVALLASGSTNHLMIHWVSGGAVGGIMIIWNDFSALSDVGAL